MGSQRRAGSDFCLVFHDLSVDPVPTLKALLKISQSNASLRSLLQNCERGIRIEFSTLSVFEKQRLPPFRTLRDLVRSAEHASPTNTILSAVLTVTSQLGCFQLLFERNPYILSSQSGSVDLLGLCKGIIVAATAAAVTTQLDLLYLSEIIVRVAFRFGLEADRRARSLSRENGPWAVAIPEKSIEEAERLVQDLNNSLNLHNHDAAYVSAQLPAATTISAPPGTIQTLTDKLRSQRILHRSLNITAPFHAGHLPLPNIPYIVDFAELDSYHVRTDCKVVSSQPDVQLHETSLRYVLRTLISGIFDKRMVLESLDGSQQSKSWPSLKKVTSVQPSASEETVRKILGLSTDVAYSTAGADEGDADTAARESDDDVAIIGVAGRFPNADTLEEYWEIIASGKDVHQPLANRVDPGNGIASKSFGCFMKNPGLFDHAFFNISPREAKQLDPQHRILLMVTQEALQMIGYSGAENKRIGTFFGQATDDWRESHIRQDVDIFYIGAGMRAFAPGRLNYHYKWEGPSYNVDTACSASLAALELASKAIQSGDCDLAVVGGGNLCSALPMFEGLAKGRFTSKTGSCKTFCETADGYCRGESIGVVILQRVSDAVRENTNIYGLVAGVSTNHSAWASSITHPHAGAQEALMLNALDAASASPSDIDYVEFHGTGTQAGDKAEMESVSRVFDQQGMRSTPLYVGAVKSNIGHCEAAAGIVSLIKALLMLQNDTIPPHCGIKKHLSRAVQAVMSSDLQISEKALPFRFDDRPRSILINNFNATGGNTCMVLRDGPRTAALPSKDVRTHFPVVVTGQSLNALEANLTRMGQYLEQISDDDLPHVSYSTTARRVHYSHRKAFTAASRQGLIDAISQIANNSNSAAVKAGPLVAFVFAGQGTQKQGIASELFKTSASFRSTLKSFETICASLNYPSFIDFLTDNKHDQDWSTVRLQLATVAIELALARLWQNWGVEPSSVVGHSIGEYAALCVAGVISEVDMFSLVGKRAQLMEELCQANTHSMLSVQSSPEETAELLRELQIKGCEISCYNSRSAVTLGGPREGLQALKDELLNRKIKSVMLSAKYAYHSENIEPILESYRDFAKSISFKQPQIPVLSTLLGEQITQEGVFDADYLVRQARNPVRFVEALEICNGTQEIWSRSSVWIEFGPGDPACLSFVKSTIKASARAQVLPSLTTRASTWQSISDNLSRCFEEGVDIDWKTYHREHEASLRLLDMPKYAFDLQDFWMPAETEAQKPETQPSTIKIDPMLHSLERQTSGKGGSSVEFRSSLTDQYLAETISGHFVMGVPLCPSSVYCVMALRAASFLNSKDDKEADASAWKLDGMDIHHPLVLQDSDSRSVGVSAEQSSGSNKVSVKFTSHGSEKSAQKHAHCTLSVESSESWRSDWSKIEFLVQSRMEQLESSKTESVHHLTSPVIYKLFSHIVDYSKPFRGIQHMALDTKANEAMAEIQFDDTADAEEDYNVHLMDSLMHFAGFILNNGIDNDEFAFVSDGWDCLRVPHGMKPGNRYKFYIRLAPDAKDKSYSGDLYVFAERKIVASCGGVRFTKMKKESLRRALSRGAAQSSGSGKVVSEKKQSKSEQESSSKMSQASGNHPAESLEAKLRQIVAQEAGVSSESVSDTTGLPELGLDSILMSTIVDKIHEELGIEIGTGQAQSAQSFAELKALALPSEDEARYTSPPTVISSENEKPQDPLPGRSDSQNQQASNLMATILSIVVQHTGVPEETVLSIDDFSKLGVDSMLSMDILDMIQETAGVELPSSFLQSNPNIESIGKALSRSSSSSPSNASSATTTYARNSPRTTATSTPYSEPTPPSSASISPQLKPSKPVSAPRKAFDIGQSTSRSNPETPSSKSNDGQPSSKFQARLRLVQGSGSSGRTPVFVFPPGGGNHDCYNLFPPHKSNTPIYCPESPFMNDPDNEIHTFVNLSRLYKKAVQSRQSSGPYMLAGYSVGGAYAYEVARLLLEEGEKVDKLVILETPAPAAPLNGGQWFGIEAMTMAGWREYLDENCPGYPEKMHRHTAAATREYNRYEPKPFGDKRPGKVVVLMATHGRQEEFPARCLTEQKLLDECAVEDRVKLIEKRRRTADVEWHSGPQADLDPKAWKKLCGGDLEVIILEGTHFSIMNPPKVTSTAEKFFAALNL